MSSVFGWQGRWSVSLSNSPEVAIRRGCRFWHIWHHFKKFYRSHFTTAQSLALKFLSSFLSCILLQQLMPIITFEMYHVLNTCQFSFFKAIFFTSDTSIFCNTLPLFSLSHSQLLFRHLKVSITGWTGKSNIMLSHLEFFRLPTLFAFVINLTNILPHV